MLGKYFRVNMGASYLHNFQEVNGKVKYYIEQPEQKDYYLFMNELYRKGLITAENFTWDKGDKANSKIVDGSAVAINNMYDYASINTSIKKNGNKYELVPITNVLGKHAKNSVNSVGWAGLFVTKNCNNTKAAAKFLKFIMSDEGQKLGLWGIEGEDYTMQDGEDIYNGGYPKFNYDSQNTDEQKKNGSVWWGLLADKGEYEAVQRYVKGTKLTEFETNYKPIVENNPMLGAITFKSNSDEQVIQGNIDEVVTREESKIYLAKSVEEAENEYNSMMSKIHDLNINKIDLAGQKQVDKLKKEYDKLQ
jgi:putative aldouronate transport system substrate-binding protein